MIEVRISSPLWNSGAFSHREFNNLTAYADVNKVDGGYESATFSFNLNEEEFSWLLSHGVGADVLSINPDTTTRWEGFINRVTLNFGRLGVVLGPFTDIKNKVKLRYQDFASGNSVTTSYSSDAESQDVFGIRQTVLSTGKISGTNATAIVSNYLEENGYIAHTNQFNLSGTDFSANIECLGYVYMLDYPYYNSNIRFR